MGTVASFGSVNVDRVAYVDADEAADLEARYDWFPARGETRSVESVPEAVDRLVDETFLGGKGANQAVAAARADATSGLYGKVGTDHGSFDVLSSLAGFGVDVSSVEVAEAPTGTAYVFVIPGGENHIAIVGGANAAVDPAYAHAHAETLRGADCLLVQNELPGPAIDALFTALDGQHDRPTVIFDPAPAAGAADLLGHACVDFALPNEAEAAALGDALDRFEGTVVYKHGPEPVVVDPAEGERFTVEPPAVDAVDTTGAGDVFAGYLAAELSRDVALREAVECACVAGTLSVEVEGVQRATPMLERVRAYRREIGS
ncbi:PfkB family carbohydrate kinase [Salinirubellus sp. GCM10025818]|uniref:PfkB family carbohydrate kinase n=1 Tax=Salinirubellus TaxID=2162630 RepID=UPI0030CDDC44